MKKSALMLCLMMAGAAITTLPVATPAHALASADFSSLVEQVAPSVVRISITKQVDDETLAQARAVQMLKGYLGEQAQLPDIPVIEQGYGTGFFISSDGYLLTNHHVIAGADRITVTLNDRTELDATLIGSDESSDIAVLKVAGNHYPALPVAKADTLKVGEPVLAIGSPFGFDYSASAGIVSAKSRNVSREAAVPFIQSDVALNPGNSGGPLFNRQGEVVGVNSLIFSGTGGYMGLSFSIPIDVAMDIYQQIRQNGKVTRVYLGISVQDVDRNLAEAYGLTKPQGALLTRVVPNFPADQVGLKTGDVVLSFNQMPIVHAHDLLNQINRARPNDAFELTYQRQGKVYTAKGNFGEAQEDTAIQSRNKAEGVRLGLRLRALNANERRTLQSQGVSGGVLVTSVDLVGRAAKAGISTGDVIIGLNQQSISSVEDFASAVTNLPKTGVITVQLIRQGTPAIIGMRIDE